MLVIVPPRKRPRRRARGLAIRAAPPGERPAADGPKPAALAGQLQSGKKSRTVLVLVVEDFEDAREMLVECLNFAGYPTAEAATGTEALEKAESLRPQIILMDLTMPGIDGWEASRRLKKNPYTRRIPIIVVTAHALPEDERRAEEAGCDAFLTKPVHPQELLTVVASKLGQRTK